MGRKGTAIASVAAALAVLLGAAPVASAAGSTPPPAQVVSPAAPTGAEDVFGENYLPAGNQVTITIADGRAVCVYDMKFVLEDDSEFIENAIDLCETGEYTLSDSQ